MCLVDLELGATYDSIEGRFRIIKREAAVLRAEIEQGERPEAPPRGTSTAKTAAASLGESFASSTGLPSSKVSTPRKPRTPKKTAIKSENGGGVLTGRVGKNISSPTKKGNTAIMVKSEPLSFEDSVFDEGQDLTDLSNHSFMDVLDNANFADVLPFEEGGMEI